MATTNRQTSIFGVEDWKKLYQTYSTADFQSYDFETLRKLFVDYLRSNYPETFNDYTEASEYIALLDLMAFMGQALSFRSDLNARENFIDTAERRDSVVKLASLVNYTPKRNISATGFLKITSVTTTENVFDYQNINLAGITINWNDVTNANWYEQFLTIINAALVTSQMFGRSGGTATIEGIVTDEYGINLTPGFLPVASYETTVDGENMTFEAVSASVSSSTQVYEPAPRPDQPFNILYRNDFQGYGSINTGFFFYFKQGILTSQNFTLTERINNWQQEINIEGINEEDLWLYQLDTQGGIGTQWTEVQSVYTNRDFQDNTSSRTYFSVSSRTNDQVSLNFGDGVFAEAPVGTFRVYVRQSNGLTYVINPEEMNNVQISLAYISREGKPETITFTASLQENVSNSQARESLEDIKARAPSRFYSQDRMVNGEDYDNFPYTQYNSIIKSKAIARSIIGTARNLDLIDPTGKFSSVNLWADDGALYQEFNVPAFNFVYSTVGDISNILLNAVQPLVKSRPMLQYYYERTRQGTDPNLTRKGLNNVYWHQVTAATNQCTGYFVNSEGSVLSVGPRSGSSTANRRYIAAGALVKFLAPAGKIFDLNNRLVSNIGRTPQPGDKTLLWAPVLEIVGDGTGNDGTGTLGNGAGAVTLGGFIPGNGAVNNSAAANQIIPVFVNTFGSDLLTVMIDFILTYRDFGIAFDNTNQIWKPVYPTDSDFDSTWLIKFTTNGTTYTVNSRSLTYVFASVDQVRFFYDEFGKIFDVKTGRVVNDFIKVLGTNRSPVDPMTSLLADVYLDIVGQKVEPDGFVNDFNVEVSFTDTDADSAADNPDVFETIVGNTVVQSSARVFLERVLDLDNLERYIVIDGADINTSYPTKPMIELEIETYTVGQLFYAYQDRQLSTVTSNVVVSLTRRQNVTTVVMNQSHELATGDFLLIDIVSDTEFSAASGTTVTVIDAVTFSYSNPGSNQLLLAPIMANITQPAGFWRLDREPNGNKYLRRNTDYIVRTGRYGLYFQYRHNSPDTRRINPGVSNIIDLYLVTNAYYTEYQNWIQDTTGSVGEPNKPTTGELRQDYQGLENFKMITDNVILDSVTFKPLFGNKAMPNLQATFKVIKNVSVTVSDQEVKSSVVAALNEYFNIDNWDFGQTFYFSELSAYLHRNLGDIISSVVIVPVNSSLGFGNLYEIQSGPTEIFVNAATVNDVEIVAALTATNLRIQTQT